MNRTRLTLQRIEAFRCPDSKHQVFLRDTVSPHLAVRATSGVRSFVFKSKLRRRNIRITLGDVRDWALDEARAEANRLQVLVDRGTDPRDLAREAEAAKA